MPARSSGVGRSIALPAAATAPASVRNSTNSLVAVDASVPTTAPPIIPAVTPMPKPMRIPASASSLLASSSARRMTRW